MLWQHFIPVARSRDSAFGPSLLSRGRAAAQSDPAHAQGDEFLVRLTGNWAGTPRVNALLRLCRELMRRGAARVVVDIAATCEADTRLVACLVVIVGEARSNGVAVEVRSAGEARSWIEVCRVGGMMDGGVGR